MLLDKITNFRTYLSVKTTNDFDNKNLIFFQILIPISIKIHAKKSHFSWCYLQIKKSSSLKVLKIINFFTSS